MFKTVERIHKNNIESPGHVLIMFLLLFCIKRFLSFSSLFDTTQKNLFEKKRFINLFNDTCNLSKY
ncbi:hypothetical protein HZS_3398 [Henneguya salminicola]|nr:hypothetical protein HZS_3398 [Henneguya salminicola]